PCMRKSLKRVDARSIGFGLIRTIPRLNARPLAKDDAMAIRQTARCTPRLTRPMMANRMMVTRDKIAVDFKRKAANARIVNDNVHMRKVLRACQFALTK